MLQIVIVGGLLVLIALAVLNHQANAAASTGEGTPQRPPAPNAVVGAIAIAIASAEGYYLGKGHIPYDYNNPGDITDYASLYSSGTNGITIFPTAEAGWNALYEKISNILNGSSDTYDPSSPLSEIGATWANGDPNWADNVAAKLGGGVSSSTSLGEYATANADQAATE